MSGAMDQAAEIGNLIETAYVALNNPRMDNSNFTVAKDAIEKAHRMLPKELAALRSLIQDLEHPGAWLTLEQLEWIEACRECPACGALAPLPFERREMKHFDNCWLDAKIRAAKGEA